MADRPTRCCCKKDLLIIMIVMAAFLLQHLLSFHLGINFEEAREGNAYYLAMQGDRPYGDFEWDYGPFAFLVYPFIMKIFGVNLIVLRLSYILFTSLVIPLAYFLSRRIIPPLWSGLAAFLAINFFDVPYYTFNHIFAVLGELGCLLVVASGIETKRYTISFLFAGLLAAVVLLTKPFLSGVSLCLAVFFFFFILKKRNWINLKIANAMSAFFGVAFLITVLFALVYLGQAVKDYFLESIPLFAPNPNGLVYYLGTPRLAHIIARLAKRFFGLFAIFRILTANSITGLKMILVQWFNDFIFYLPFLTPAGLFVIYKFFSKRNIEFENIFKKYKITILLLVIFSVSIAIEGLLVAHRMNRAFSIQTTFILMVFLFSLLVNAAQGKGRTLTLFLILLFSFSLSFLHFFRYPWSRSKKFTHSLNLERARGILVSRGEKNVYESISAYFSAHLGKEEPIVVMGYNPQFVFFTGQRNLFENEEHVFLKLEALSRLSREDRSFLSKLRLVEDQIIDALKLHQPKIVLDVIYNANEPLDNRVRDYIKQQYILRKTYGPAELRGEEESGMVRLYALKGRRP